MLKIINFFLAIAAMGYLCAIQGSAFLHLQRSERSGSPFQFSLRTMFLLLLVIAMVIAFLCHAPIWHWHGDFGGWPHGHSIWVGDHIH